MKTFETIKKLSNLGRILSKIVFICTIIGFCLMVLLMVLFMTIIDQSDVVEIIESLLNKDIGTVTNLGVILIALFVAFLISFAGRLVTSKYAENYFKKVIADGTPFNEENAKRIFKLGVMLICISLITSIIVENTVSAFLMKIGVTESLNFSINLPAGVILGGLFIFLSYVCKLGAEILSENVLEAGALPVNEEQ